MPGFAQLQTMDPWMLTTRHAQATLPQHSSSSRKRSLQRQKQHGGWCRWIERYNKKLREAAKKEDARRLKSFVGAAEACDPRILQRAQEQKAERFGHILLACMVQQQILVLSSCDLANVALISDNLVEQPHDFDASDHGHMLILWLMAACHTTGHVWAKVVKCLAHVMLPAESQGTPLVPC